MFERKAFKKGLDYLYQARMSDGLDPAVPNLLAEGHVLQAIDHFQKGRIDLGRKALEGTKKLAVHARDNFARGKWCLKAREGIIESAWGDAELGRALLEEAREASPSEAAFCYFVYRHASILKPRGERIAQEFRKRLDKLTKQDANGACAVLLTRIYQHLGKPGGKRRVRHNSELVDTYLMAASQHPCSREDARKLGEFGVMDEEFAEIVIPFVTAQLAVDPRDPVFRLLRFQLGFWDGNAIKELQGIIDEAGHRRDDQTARQARKELEDDSRARARRPFDYLYEEDYDDDEEDEDFDGVYPGPNENAKAGLKEGAGLREVLELLGRALTEKTKGIKDSIPQEEHDPDPLAMPPDPKLPVRPKKIWSDPNQPDLFNP